MAAESLFDPGEQASSSNLSVLLNRTKASLAKVSDQSLLSADTEFLWLEERGLEVDARAIKAATERIDRDPNDVQGCFALAELVGAISGPPLQGLEHALLEPIRRELEDQVLDALLALASGPLASQFRGLILDKLELLGLRARPTSSSIERLLTILGKLRLRDLLVTTYLEFEELLLDEIGETPNPEVAALLDRLVQQIERAPATPQSQAAPKRPDQTVGGSALITKVARQLISSPGSSLVNVLIGQSGIGKSHFLHELYWQLSESLVVHFVDLDTVPADRILSYLRDQAFDVLLLDHLEPEKQEILAQLKRAYPECPIVCASPVRLPHLGDSTIVLRALDVGTALSPGPAMELVVASREAVLSHAGPESVDMRAVQAIAQLCDGIPLALEFAGKLSATIGLVQTQKSLSRDLQALGSVTVGRNSRHTSLFNAIRSSFEVLSPGAKQAVKLLTLLDQACHMDQLVSAGDLRIQDIEDALLSGLVAREPNSAYVRVVRSTALVVRDLVPEAEAQELRNAFDTKSCEWFDQMAAQVPLDLSISPSTALGIAITNRLFQRGDPSLAFALLRSLRVWLGSGLVSVEQIKSLEPYFYGDAIPDEGAWVGAVLSLGAALFHTGAYDAMHEFLSRAYQQRESEGLRSDMHCQLLLQLALAKRCLGQIDEAVEGYRQVAEQATAVATPATLVKAYFNLGTTLEAVDRLPEALAALDHAKVQLTQDADPRTETLILLGIARLRFRIGDDLREIIMVFEAILAHAMDRGDLRIFAETLQNSGLVYLAQGEYLTSALAETIGSAYLLQFGYSNEFRRLTKSSFVTLGTALMHLNQRKLASRTRILIDRLGTASLYAPNQLLFDEFETQTYATPPGFNLTIAPELEIADHLQECYTRLIQITESAPVTPSLFRLMDVDLPTTLSASATADAATL